MSTRLFLTDSGLETTLSATCGYTLPAFAAFGLLDHRQGRDELRAYYREHAELAQACGYGFVFETPTWRANGEWGRRLGYDAPTLEAVNREAVRLLQDIADGFPALPSIISGQIGPRGEGYGTAGAMGASEAERYHSAQIAALAEADIITALTITSVGEAVGIARAAAERAIPCVISFTTETDGSLPLGPSLNDAIEEVDARTDGSVAYFMVNCVHPTHIHPALTPRAAKRVGGVRLNAWCLSHTELDAALWCGADDPQSLAAHCRALSDVLPALRVVGGCCGTSLKHLREIAAALEPETA
ncbi:MAG: homocysteine S-methyltransferase family protein [Pseudomonadota bacterium]